MNKLKRSINESNFAKASVFIIFNAVLLCLLFFLTKNLGKLTSVIYGGFCAVVDAFWPLIIGLILAYLLNPLSDILDAKVMSKFIKLPADPIKAEKRKNFMHLISVLLTFLIVIASIIAIIYGFAVMIIGRITVGNWSDTITDIISGIVEYHSSFRDWISTNIPAGFLSDKLTGMTNYIMGRIGNSVDASYVITLFSDISGHIIDIVIGVIIAIYLMKDKRFFLGLWRKFLHLVLPQKYNAMLVETLNEINGVLSRFIRGALLDALIVSILSSVGLSIMGLEAAVFIGVFAGLVNVIPYFGPVMGMIPAFLMGFFTGGFWHGVLAVIILLAVQQIDSNLIYPKIVGTSTGLHPLMVLLAVSVFGYFAGIIGMLLAVPIAGIIQVFVVKWATGKERKRVG